MASVLSRGIGPVCGRKLTTFQMALKGCVIGKVRDPSDPVGTATVTFAGVAAGSEIRVYSPAGVEVAGVESCAANQVLSWPVYAAGNPSNTVTLRLVHLSYEVMEFSYVTTPGSTVIPIQQRRDRWYANP